MYTQWQPNGIILAVYQSFDYVYAFVYKCWIGGEEQSQAAALVRCELMQQGQPIGHYDTLIAAHARSLSAVLVTHNVREFERVQGYCWRIGNECASDEK